MKHSLVCALLVCAFPGASFNNLLADDVSPEILARLQAGLNDLQAKVAELRKSPATPNPDHNLLVADVDVCAKAVEWMLRHNEFPKKEYADQAASAIELGRQRAAELLKQQPTWELRPGVSIRGYVSKVDGSVQPYALTLPAGVNPLSGDRWPLHVKLHGRADGMNEVNFIARHEGKPLPKGQTWIQLDVYGRGNNAYRWAGETDVFEAIADVRRRFRIDDHRITLHGFSMGGAGSWHLGLHYPAMWSSVGPGAGFVDFYNYQKQTEQRPPWQHATLGIYDAIDYSLNAFNVPVCSYGGELDAQLIASTSMVEAAKQQNVDIRLLIGEGMGHKFHPDSFKQFMAFHQEKSAAGRQFGSGRKHIRFTTRTLKYNSCDWLTIEEVERVYVPTTVEAVINDDGNVEVTTDNVSALSLSRDVGTLAVIDGETLPLADAGEGLLPNVYFVKNEQGWVDLNYDDSRDFQNNPERNKRRNLQGPIDDAFMGPFVCVTGSHPTRQSQHDEWVRWTLQQFESEFDQWMRARVRSIRDMDLDADTIAGQHLILFGDPSSNSVLKQVLPALPVEWTDDSFTVNGKTFSTNDHGLSLIFPNPLNARKYVVINSGQTFHDRDFRASNSWLFPRLGDIAVRKFAKNAEGGYDEEIIWAANFNSGWELDPVD
ncbi:MAG: alpha/beta hydrolase-fold protein [Planctomycetaceae bacterium]